MTTNRAAVALALLLAVLVPSCKDDQGPTQGEGEIAGKVTDASSGNPLAQVNIQAQSPSSTPRVVMTDEEGNYRLTFEVDSTLEVTLHLSKSGYRDTAVTVMLEAGVLYPLSIRLSPRSVIVGNTGGGTGLAQTITFLGSDPTEVSVYGVGGQETSILGFEVRDSLGIPVDAAHAVILTFTVLGGLNGGEYISPPAVQTNASGRAFTTFNAGIRSGVVQVLVSTTVAGRTITSSPVRLVINAGFADQTHFTVAAEHRNFPTLGVAGNRDGIGVIVGDIYSNPVVQNTAVYFRTSAGVIQASVFTNADGEGTAALISGNPAPFGLMHAAPDSGDGYHYVVARTIGQGGTPVEDSVLILWSGHSQVRSVTPGSFDIANGGFQEFEFEVADFLGHPLAEGTTITVTATVPPPPDPLTPVNQVQLSFGQDGSVILDDVIGRGFGSTHFRFRLSDGSVLDQATAVSVSITVTGPNGLAYRTINGIVH
ncbi:MAG: carboxypeptidase regulatory-like domain-containing protein [Bacteroidota bacterium]